MLGRFYDVEPDWEGTSYSYVRPPRKKNTTEAATIDRNSKTSSRHNDHDYSRDITESTDTDTDNSPCWETLEFPHCGSITLEQHADRVGPQGREGTGFALWSSALAISTYLDARFANSTTGTTTNLTALELGAGLGLPSIVLARHGWNVVATDHEPAVVQLLEQNLRSNLEQTYFEKNDESLQESHNNEPATQQPTTHDHPRVSIETLDWAHPQEDLIEALAPDLIIASDVVWNATRPIWPEFLSVLCRLRHNYVQKNKKKHRQNDSSPSPLSPTTTIAGEGGGDTTPSGSTSKSPLVLMGYTQRRLDMSLEDERHFFNLLRSFGMQGRALPDATNSDHWPLTVLLELQWVDDN